MRITLLYNEPAASRYDALGEGVAIASVRLAVDAIKDVLESQGHAVALLGLQPPMSSTMAALKGIRADVVFNLFEGFAGSPETESQVALALESTGLSFTGARATTLALCLDKAKAKETMSAVGVPIPAFQLLSAGDLGRFSLVFPVIVKPAHEDASHGMNSNSVVYDLGALAAQVAWVEGRYGSPALVESFLPGREFNASILGGLSPRVLPATEIVYKAGMPGPRILTYAAKWIPEDPVYQATVPVCPAPVSKAVAARINELALAAHSAVGAPHYARVDFRMDARGSLYALEVNPNPDLSPDTGMSIQADADGMGYAGMIGAILELLLEEIRLGRHYVTSDAR